MNLEVTQWAVCAKYLDAAIEALAEAREKLEKSLENIKNVKEGLKVENGCRYTTLPH